MSARARRRDDGFETHGDGAKQIERDDLDALCPDWKCVVGCEEARCSRFFSPDAFVVIVQGIAVDGNRHRTELRADCQAPFLEPQVVAESESDVFAL